MHTHTPWPVNSHIRICTASATPFEVRIFIYVQILLFRCQEYGLEAAVPAKSIILNTQNPPNLSLIRDNICGFNSPYAFSNDTYSHRWSSIDIILKSSKSHVSCYAPHNLVTTTSAKRAETWQSSPCPL